MLLIQRLHAFAVSLAVLSLCACGGGGGSDPSAGADQGTVYVGITDAEGDFLRYEVDVVSIRLLRADGTEVDALPRRARLDFARYVDLTEFFTAAQVPEGRYLQALITLDYAEADVWVDVGGTATRAAVVDPDGNVLGTYSLEVQIDGERPLVVRPGLPSLLTVDFDLAASHRVDLTQTPPRVTAAPLLTAEIDSAGDRPLRVRGPLVEVSLERSSYVVDLRPFHRRSDEFGRVSVQTTPGTRFELNGVEYGRNDGLQALADLPAGTPTLAQGSFDVATRRFTARVVQAGDSVPGVGLDTVVGNVTRRQGNLLSVRGALIVPRTGAVRFQDDVQVQIGEDTRVTGPDLPAASGIEAVSVGQRVEVFGQLGTGAADTPPILDADPGRIRLVATHVGGIVNGNITGQLRLHLASIDGRRIDIFDFAGTGMTPALDADPADYEIATAGLDLANLDAGEPAQVVGLVRPFGAAPDDFVAISVIDPADELARLGIGWGAGGTTSPFLSIGPDALVLDLDNPDIGLRHHLLTADLAVDLFDLPASPAIVPVGPEPGRYAIAAGPRVEVFSRFGPFAARLAELLDGSRRAFALHAEGRYEGDLNTLGARAVAVNLGLPPGG